MPPMPTEKTIQPARASRARCGGSFIKPHLTNLTVPLKKLLKGQKKNSTDYGELSNGTSGSGRILESELDLI